MTTLAFFEGKGILSPYRGYLKATSFGRGFLLMDVSSVSINYFHRKSSRTGLKTSIKTPSDLHTTPCVTLGGA